MLTGIPHKTLLKSAISLTNWYVPFIKVVIRCNAENIIKPSLAAFETQPQTLGDFKFNMLDPPKWTQKWPRGRFWPANVFSCLYMLLPLTNCKCVCSIELFENNFMY